MAQFINPYKMGLLGGLASWASTMEKFNLLHEQEAARERQYQIKYGAMSDVKTLQAKNNLLLKQLQLESQQRTYNKVTQNPDGSYSQQAMRRVYNPDSGAFEDHAIGDPTPWKSPSQLQDEREKAMGDRMTATQKAIGDRQATTLQGIADRAAAHEKAVGDRTDQREAARDTANDKKDRAIKLGQAEQQTNADMKAWRAMSPQEKMDEMRAAGVPVTADTVDDPTAMNRYRMKVLAQHKNELGIGDEPAKAAAGAPAQGAAPQPGDADFNGPPDIRKGADGKQYLIKGTDPNTGKVNAVPLAMDDMPDDSAIAATGGDNEAGESQPDDEQAEQGAPLLAGADEGEQDVFSPQSMDAEDDQADEEDAATASGLMSGAA